jgi:threonine/homoserine/homoserine lactone efflux protein
LTMTASTIAALFSVMVAGALVPGVGVLTVLARTAAAGVSHGIAVTLGIALGDILYIVIALFGLSFLAEALGDGFVLIKYLGAIYLVWLGITVWRSGSKTTEIQKATESSLQSSFFAGLVITMADQKAILFYFGLLPAFLDMSVITYIDVGIIVVLAIIAISTKLIYVLMADRAGRFLRSTGVVRRINVVAGAILIAVGLYIFIPV